jgi:hypothetical protein
LKRRESSGLAVLGNVPADYRDRAHQARRVIDSLVSELETAPRDRGDLERRAQAAISACSSLRREIDHMHAQQDQLASARAAAADRNRRQARAIS